MEDIIGLLGLYFQGNKHHYRSTFRPEMMSREKLLLRSSMETQRAPTFSGTCTILIGLRLHTRCPKVSNANQLNRNNQEEMVVGSGPWVQTISQSPTHLTSVVWHSTFFDLYKQLQAIKKNRKATSEKSLV